MQKTSTKGTAVNNSNPFLQQILNALENLFQDHEGPARVLEMIDDMHLSHAVDPIPLTTMGKKEFRNRVFDMQVLRNALMSMGQAYLMMHAQRHKQRGEVDKSNNTLLTIIELLSPQSHEKTNQETAAPEFAN